MKNRTLKAIIFINILTVICVCISGCGSAFRYGGDYNEIVYNEYGFSKVYFSIRCGVNHDFIRKDNSGVNVIYVGEKHNGEFIIIVIPHMKAYEPYEVEWPFNFSLYEAIEKINEEHPCSLDNTYKFSCLENQETLSKRFPTITKHDYDFLFFITYSAGFVENDEGILFEQFYHIGQKDGELVIYLSGRDFILEIAD